MECLRRLFIEENGQGLVEYALLIALIALASIGGLMILGGGLQNAYEDFSNRLSEL